MVKIIKNIFKFYLYCREFYIIEFYGWFVIGYIIVIVVVLVVIILSWIKRGNNNRYNLYINIIFLIVIVVL